MVRARGFDGARVGRGRDGERGRGNEGRRDSQRCNDWLSKNPTRLRTFLPKNVLRERRRQLSSRRIRQRAREWPGSLVGQLVATRAPVQARLSLLGHN